MSKCSCGREPNPTCYMYYKTNQSSFEPTPQFYKEIKRNAKLGLFGKNRDIVKMGHYHEKCYHKPVGIKDDKTRVPETIKVNKII